jgi:hypothetical protein
MRLGPYGLLPLTSEPASRFTISYSVSIKPLRALPADLELSHVDGYCPWFFIGNPLGLFDLFTYLPDKVIACTLRYRNSSR